MFSQELFAKKLKQTRIERNLTGIELANHIGVSKGAISQWENGIALPSISYLYALCEALNIEPADLIEFDSCNDSLNKPLKDYSEINKYFDLTERQRETVRNVIKGQLGITLNEKIKPLKLFNQSACAGDGNLIDSTDFDIVEFVNPPKTAEFAIRVQGKSMEPLIEDGDIIYINPNAQLQDKEIGIFTYQGETYVKQLKALNGKTVLHSLNPKFKDIEILYPDELFVCGRVL